MAHFAQLDYSNTVVQVIVIHNNELVVDKQSSLDEEGRVVVSAVEHEAKGIAFCKALYGADTQWVQTSYNGSFRGKYAAIGDVYDSDANEFKSPVVVPTGTAPISTLSTQPPVELTTTQVVSLTSADLALLDTAQLDALTTQQISGLE